MRGWQWVMGAGFLGVTVALCPWPGGPGERQTVGEMISLLVTRQRPDAPAAVPSGMPPVLAAAAPGWRQGSPWLRTLAVVESGTFLSQNIQVKTKEGSGAAAEGLVQGLMSAPSALLSPGSSVFFGPLWVFGSTGSAPDVQPGETYTAYGSPGSREAVAGDTGDQNGGSSLVDRRLEQPARYMSTNPWPILGHSSGGTRPFASPSPSLSPPAAHAPTAPPSAPQPQPVVPAPPVQTVQPARPDTPGAGTSDGAGRDGHDGAPAAPGPGSSDAFFSSVLDRLLAPLNSDRTIPGGLPQPSFNPPVPVPGSVLLPADPAKQLQHFMDGMFKETFGGLEQGFAFGKNIPGTRGSTDPISENQDHVQKDFPDVRIPGLSGSGPAGGVPGTPTVVSTKSEDRIFGSMDDWMRQIENQARGFGRPPNLSEPSTSVRQAAQPANVPASSVQERHDPAPAKSTPASNPASVAAPSKPAAGSSSAGTANGTAGSSAGSPSSFSPAGGGPVGMVNSLVHSLMSNSLLSR